MDGPLEFVFSLRSPYAWIAARRVVPRVHPSIEVTWTPLYPLPEFQNFGNLLPIKVRYLVEDVRRLAKDHDLPLGFPPAADPDWVVPHSAFVYAEEHDAGPALAMALMDPRWSRGEDAASEDVMRGAALGAGLDADALLAASADPARHDALRERIRRNYDERGLFGVPMFVLSDGARFWGHDRMEWALDHGYVPARECA
jgi:2-hydroxychromene-2-carboxylate isomerase